MKIIARYELLFKYHQNSARSAHCQSLQWQCQLWTADLNHPSYSRVSLSSVLTYVVEGHPLFAISCVGTHVISCSTGASLTLQIPCLRTLPLVINYALLEWAKKLKSSKCWWGQCVLVMHAIFRICGNESQPGPQHPCLVLNGKGHLSKLPLSSLFLTLSFQAMFFTIHSILVSVPFRPFSSAFVKDKVILV